MASKIGWTASNGTVLTTREVEQIRASGGPASTTNK